MSFHSPPILRMSCSPDMAWITEPADEEQQRLEEGMRDEVEHRGLIGRDAGRKEHVAELRAGRIGDDFLDVVLRHADAGGEDAGGAADHHDEAERDRRILEHRRQARHHEHARRHHRRGMDQGRDRRRAFHRVGQPGVQADLRRFAHRADEQKDAGDGQRVDMHAEEHETSCRPSPARRRTPAPKSSVPNR